jgi:hypothetical protein
MLTAQVCMFVFTAFGYGFEFIQHYAPFETQLGVWTTGIDVCTHLAFSIFFDDQNYRNKDTNIYVLELSLVV